MTDREPNAGRPQPPAASRPLPALKRKRAKRSCDFCRKRKSKCDADTAIPCTNCLAWGFECQFQSKSKKRGPRSPYVTGLEQRCKELENLLKKYTNDIPKERAVPKSDEEMSDDQNGSPEDPNAQASDDDDPWMHTPQPSATLPKDADAHDIEERLSNISLENYDTIKYTGSSAGLRVLDKSVFKDGRVVWPGRDNVVLQMLPHDELVVLKTDVSKAGNPEVQMGIGIGMQMGIFGSENRNWSPKSDCRNALYPTVLDKYITMEQRKVLLDAYFSEIHPVLPILNKRRFLHQFEAGTIPPVLLFSILAVAYRYVKPESMQISVENLDLGAFLYRRVMTYLRCHFSKSVIHIVQANLLMVIYLDLEDSDTESIQWYALGNAIRMAQDLGLHRSSADWEIPKSEIETRHRLFFACYILDRWIGARSGKPLTILDRDFDTAFPSAYEVYNSGDLEASPSASGALGTPQQEEEPIYLAFIHLIKLSEILGRILKALYAPKAKYANHNAGIDDPTILLVFDRRLNHWKATLDAGMIPKGKGEPKSDPENPDQNEVKDLKIDPQQRIMLDVCYHIAQLLLHRQFMQAPAQELDDAMKELVTHSHMICTQAAANIINLSNQAEIRHYISVSPTSLIYSVFQGALIHIYNINKDNLKMQSKFNLQRSMGFLVERRKWLAVSRVIEILKLMATLNGITDKSVMALADDGSVLATNETPAATTPPKKRRRARTASNSVHAKESTVQPKIEEPADDQTRSEQLRTTSIPAYLPFSRYVGDEMPKGQWVQRMMNTSVVGGITPDIQPSINSVLALNHPGSIQRDRSTMEGLTNTSGISSPLTEMHMRQPMTMQTADPALIPWHHLQMLPQGYSPYPMYAPPPPGSTAHAPAMHTMQHQYPNHLYTVPSNRNVPDKMDFQQQRGQPQPTMYQEHHPSRQRQDLNTLLPPGSLNWEQWNSYVDQETNRNQ